MPHWVPLGVDWSAREEKARLHLSYIVYFQFRLSHACKLTSGSWSANPKSIVRKKKTIQIRARGFPQATRITNNHIFAYAVVFLCIPPSIRVLPGVSVAPIARFSLPTYLHAVSIAFSILCVRMGTSIKTLYSLGVPRYNVGKPARHNVLGSRCKLAIVIIALRAHIQDYYIVQPPHWNI